MAELLLELLSEEIPARMQGRAAEDLKRLVCDGLKGAGLDFGAARAFATPRRLALVVEGLPVTRADVREEKRGPRVGAPDQAVQGFLKSAGLTSLDQAEKRDTGKGKGEFWFAVIRKKGGLTIDALPEIISNAIRSFPWPKSMRWGSSTLPWIRPLQSIVALFDGVEVPGGIDPGGGNALIRFRSTTRGHRFLPNGDLPPNSEFEVTDFADYVAKLRAAHVMLDPAEREITIVNEAEGLARKENLILFEDRHLLEEIAGLVEWPVPLMGKFDDEFLELPAEVLTTSMRTHQRYFPTYSPASDPSKPFERIANRFIFVANNNARDGGKAIIAGNERVLHARLYDAKFFWDQDRKLRLEERLPALKDIVFHAKLGTQADRVQRIAALATALAEDIPGSDKVQIMMAAELCKADLVTGMVGEFPELQGVMGRYYALGEKLPMAVAEAIGDHYAPAGLKDRCPSAPVSVAVALADKLDALVSFWSIGEKPTGSRDPYALRRAALGVIRLIVENKLRIALGTVLEATFARVDEGHSERREAEARRRGGDFLIATGKVRSRGDGLSPRTKDLLAFFADRLKVQMREQGVRHDIVDAVFAVGHEDDLIRLLARVEALQSFLGTEAGRNLLTAYGRAANIVRAEEKKEKGLGAKLVGPADPGLLEQAEEKNVATALAEMERTVRPALEREDFSGAMNAFAGLRAPIDALFEKVTVNVADKPQLRLNRLKLLNQIRAAMDSVADFSRIEG